MILQFHVAYQPRFVCRFCLIHCCAPICSADVRFLATLNHRTLAIHSTVHTVWVFFPSVFHPSWTNVAVHPCVQHASPTTPSSKRVHTHTHTHTILCFEHCLAHLPFAHMAANQPAIAHLLNYISPTDLHVPLMVRNLVRGQNCSWKWLHLKCKCNFDVSSSSGACCWIRCIWCYKNTQLDGDSPNMEVCQSLQNY